MHSDEEDVNYFSTTGIVSKVEPVKMWKLLKLGSKMFRLKKKKKAFFSKLYNTMMQVFTALILMFNVK